MSRELEATRGIGSDICAPGCMYMCLRRAGGWPDGRCRVPQSGRLRVLFPADVACLSAAMEEGLQSELAAIRQQLREVAEAQTAFREEVHVADRLGISSGRLSGSGLAQTPGAQDGKGRGVRDVLTGAGVHLGSPTRFVTTELSLPSRIEQLLRCGPSSSPLRNVSRPSHLTIIFSRQLGGSPFRRQQRVRKRRCRVGRHGLRHRNCFDSFLLLLDESTRPPHQIRHPRLFQGQGLVCVCFYRFAMVSDIRGGYVCSVVSWG